MSALFCVLLIFTVHVCAFIFGYYLAYFIDKLIKKVKKHD